jgi:hypothetical protein
MVCCIVSPFNHVYGFVSIACRPPRIAIINENCAESGALAAWKQLVHFVDRQLAPLLPVQVTDACVTDAMTEQLMLFNMALAKLMCLTAASSRAERASTGLRAQRKSASAAGQPHAPVASALHAAVQSCGAFAAYSARPQVGAPAASTSGRDPHAADLAVPWISDLLSYFESVLTEKQAGRGRQQQGGRSTGHPAALTCFSNALWGLERLWHEVCCLSSALA